MGCVTDETVCIPAKLNCHFREPVLNQNQCTRRLSWLIGICKTGHDGLIGVAFEETHDDLVAYTRDSHHVVLTAGPTLAHLYPAGALFVTCPVSVPRKLYFDAPELIAIGFLISGANDLS